jgi:hypothetical protein
MGTRSTIAIQNADGTVSGIYCHWDGCLSHNGTILQDHYNTEDRVRELLALGNISSLGAEIGTMHDFDVAPRGKCNAYGRDRGDKDQGARTCHSWRQFIQEEGQEYNYLFIPNQGWRVGTRFGVSNLATALATETEEE